MKDQWLNLVLVLTNKIYIRKQVIIGGVGIKVVADILVLLVQEIILNIISLPLYIGMRSAGVTAYLEDKDSYEKVTFDYNLRRVLTLTGTSVVFFIWFFKLAMIVFLPNMAGPLQLYKISDLKQVDLAQTELLSDTQIQTARVMDNMLVPELIGVEKIKGDKYAFYGTGQALTSVVLLVSDKQSAVLTSEVGRDGKWEIILDEEDFKLSDGNHSIVAFNYDQNLQTRSKTSVKQYFKVTSSALDKLINNTDIFINSTIIIIIAMGILITVLII